MVTPPPFLQRCFRFPRSAEDREDDWFNPSRRSHRRWGRAYELSVSAEALLQTKDSADLLFHFLYAFYDCRNDDDEGEGEDHRLQRSNKIIWMSNETFITLGNEWISSRLGLSFLDHHGTAKIYKLTSLKVLAGVWIIIQQPSIAAANGALVESGTPSSRLVHESDAGMDIFLRLLAKRNYVICQSIQARTTANDDGITTFPASLDALEAFVGDPQMPHAPRTICLQDAGLSLAQWNTVIVNCNKNITIRIDYKDARDDRKLSLMETAFSNHFPAKIQICHFERAPASKRQMLLRALESTSLLEALFFYSETETKEDILLCSDAISRNRHCQKLAIRYRRDLHPFDMTLGEWKLFWGAIASHPSLQEVQVCCRDRKHGCRSPCKEKDDVLIRMIWQNTVLRKFEIDHELLFNRDSFDSAVQPVLELNCFRRVVQAIKQKPDPIHRQHHFTAALLSNQVRQRPAHRYLLLKENMDLLEQVSFTVQGKLLRAWCMTTHQSAIVETTMRDIGKAIPTNRSENESTQRGRKRKKSCSPAEVGRK